MTLNKVKFPWFRLLLLLFFFFNCAKGRKRKREKNVKDNITSSSTGSGSKCMRRGEERREEERSFGPHTKIERAKRLPAPRVLGCTCTCTCLACAFSTTKLEEKSHYSGYSVHVTLPSIQSLTIGLSSIFTSFSFSMVSTVLCRRRVAVFAFTLHTSHLRQLILS